jgi:hypothetical protein
VRRLFALVGACVMAVFFVARSGQRSGGCGPSEFVTGQVRELLCDFCGEGGSLAAG